MPRINTNTEHVECVSQNRAPGPLTSSTPSSMAPTTNAPKKGLKIGKALRSAAKLPSKVSHKSNGKNRFAPLPGENPIVVVRVQILSAKDLLAKDRNGASDP